MAESNLNPERTSGYADVQIELTQLIFRRLAPTALLGGICLAGITALMAHHYRDRTLWHITWAMVVISALRFAIIVAFPSGRTPATLDLRSAYLWRTTYGSITFLYSLSLAVATLYASARLDSTAWFLCSLGTFALAAALAANVGMQPWIVFTWCFTMLAGILILFLRVPDHTLRWSATALIVVFTYATYVSIEKRFDGVVESMRSRRRLRTLTEQDMLTGLSSRRHFQSALTAACEQHTPLALLFIDLDGFKQVNDRLGHATGDTLLTLVAERLRSAVRSTDVVARLGGDEFAILQSVSATENTAQQLAERINRAIDLPFTIGKEHVHIAASIGVRFTQATDADPNALLDNADEALYRVKRAGGNSFSFAREGRTPTETQA